MSKSHSFSIYLLKEGFDASNALKEDNKLDGSVAASNLPDGASLFVLDSVPREPWWKGYFGVGMNLSQALKGALIFLPADDRCFALSFGHVYHNLKDESYEYDFGLRVTLNAVDPDKLKSTDTLEPGEARRRRTQLPIDRDLTYFDFDKDSAILKSLTGKVKTKYEDLFKHPTGASNLRVSSSLQADELADLCRKLLDLYLSEDFKETFPDVQNISPVRDPVVIEELNANLLEALQTGNENLFLTIPEIVAYGEPVSVSFSGAGGSLQYEDVFIDRYYEYLAQHEIDPNALAIEDLKRHRLAINDENGNKRRDFPLLKCLIYDASFGTGNRVYHLNEGNWYEVEQDYVAGLKDYLDPFFIDLGLAEYTHDNEGAYNEAVAAGDPGYLCLDKTSIAPSGQSQVEPCDLYAIDQEHAVFYHVKISTLSSNLSHLFNQGVNATTLLIMEPEPSEKLKELIAGKAPEGSVEAFAQPIDEKKFRVMFAIITHKDANKKSENLPLFSRISLKRALRELELMRVPGNCGFVSDKSPKKPGKKKPKKSKAGGGGE